MAGMDKLAVLVNSFGSSVISVGREVGLDISLNKAQVSPGVKVANICAASLIGIYDIVEGEKLRIQQPDILIVEGLNVLQPPRVVPGYVSVAVSDYFDFSIYVDASEENIEQWYVDRFLELRKTAFSKADSFFKTYANL